MEEDDELDEVVVFDEDELLNDELEEDVTGVEDFGLATFIFDTCCPK